MVNWRESNTHRCVSYCLPVRLSGGTLTLHLLLSQEQRKIFSRASGETTSYHQSTKSVKGQGLCTYCYHKSSGSITYMISQRSTSYHQRPEYKISYTRDCAEKLGFGIERAYWLQTKWILTKNTYPCRNLHTPRVTGFANFTCYRGRSNL